MPLRVRELAEHEPGHHLVRAKHPRPAEALGLRERGLDVGDLDLDVS